MTLPEVNSLYSTDERCRELLAKLRWPLGVECLRCKSKKVYDLPTQKKFECGECGGRSSRELDKKTKPTRIDDGCFRSLQAAGVLVLLVCFATPLNANRSIWFGFRWSFGGGVASQRSEGVCEQSPANRRTAQATP